MKTDVPKGKLYLIPTTLGDTSPLEVLPISVKKVIEQVDYYIVEKEKTARQFIKRIVSSKQQNNLHFFHLNKFTDEMEIPNFIQPCLNGIDTGLISEAGLPAIADPGALVVGMAHENDIQVVPLVGPSSLLLALMSSGLNGQSFSFNGYLPIDKSARKQHLKKLEKISADMQQSQLFIETPYRNNALLDEMLNSLNDSTSLCIASDITLPTEFIKTKTIKDWKAIKLDLHKRPSLFIIQAALY